jgi:hypothetical protein
MAAERGRHTAERATWQDLLLREEKTLKCQSRHALSSPGERPHHVFGVCIGDVCAHGNVLVERSQCGFVLNVRVHDLRLQLAVPLARSPQLLHRVVLRRVEAVLRASHIFSHPARALFPR